MLKRIVALAVLLPTLFFGQHTIKGQFSPPEDFNVVLLYKVTPSVSEYIDNAEISEDGTFEILLDSSATKGIYRLVYAIPQEDYNFDVIYNEKENIELTFNTETGLKFEESSENKLLAAYTNSMSMITHSIGKFYREEAKDTLALLSIFKTQREAQDSFEKLAENSIAAEFIKANRPYIPESFEDVEAYANNLKTHYFDYVDFNNKTLQSSSFLNERMLNYIYGTTTDSLGEVANYKTNIDVFYEFAKKAPNATKRVLLVDAWQQMVDLNFESVANYISDTYLIPLAKELDDKELIKALTEFKNTSVGNKAPDFSFVIESADESVPNTLNALEGSERYIIVFWSSACSHCLNEIPQLEAFVKPISKDKLKVIAVALEDDDVLWKTKIKEFPDFINVLGLGKWDNAIGNNYDVTSTPTYFVLDTDKNIIAKPETIEALKLFFDDKL